MEGQGCATLGETSTHWSPVLIQRSFNLRFPRRSSVYPPNKYILEWGSTLIIGKYLGQGRDWAEGDLRKFSVGQDRCQLLPLRLNCHSSFRKECVVVLVSGVVKDPEPPQRKRLSCIGRKPEQRRAEGDGVWLREVQVKEVVLNFQKSLDISRIDSVPCAPTPPKKNN